MGLKSQINKAIRLKEIATVFFELELHYLIDILSLKYHLPWHQRIRSKSNENVPNTHPETIRQIFESLGGAFLKLGQLLALRPDLVGKNYSKAFEKLLEHVEPLEWEQVKSCINDCLPFGVATFKHIGHQAIASGSIAQVHKATLKDGTTVAVKIRRPNIEKDFKSDISILYSFTNLLTKRYDLEFMDPEKIIEEFQNYTLKELDLTHEARNIKRFRSNFKGDKTVHIPKVYSELSSSKILVMEYIDGEKLISKRHKLTNEKIIDQLTAAVYKQLFIDGFFHADLHPGNIFILLNKHKNGTTFRKKFQARPKFNSTCQIAFLDFGIVGYIDSVLRRQIANLFVALIAGDLEKTAKALISLNTTRSDPNLRQLEIGIYNSIGEYYNLSMKDVPIAKMLTDVIDVARKNNVSLPAQMVLFSKSLLTLEGSCRELDPNYNIVESARPYVKKMLSPSINLKDVPKKTLYFIQGMQALFGDIPFALRSAERKVSLLEHQISKIDSTFHYTSHIVWKVSKLIIYTLLLASFLISGSILVHTGPLYHQVSYYSIMAGSLSLILLFLIFLNLNDNTDIHRK